MGSSWLAAVGVGVGGLADQGGEACPERAAFPMAMDHTAEVFPRHAKMPGCVRDGERGGVGCFG